MRIWAVVAVLVCAVRASSQENFVSEHEKRAPAVYLKSPGERLARLASVLSLGKREDKARQILEDVDAEVRKAVADGNEKLRRLLTAEEKDVFDGLRDDTEGAPAGSAGLHHLVPSSGLDKGGSGGRGSQGGSGSGGRGGRSRHGGQGQIQPTLP
jgi:hypothetical protein